MATTLAALIAPHADDALAIGAPDKSWMTYKDLRDLSARIRTQLRAAGIGAQDRVAIVLPNGASMATTIVHRGRRSTTAWTVVADERRAAWLPKVAMIGTSTMSVRRSRLTSARKRTTSGGRSSPMSDSSGDGCRS